MEKLDAAIRFRFDVKHGISFNRRLQRTATACRARCLSRVRDVSHGCGAAACAVGGEQFQGQRHLAASEATLHARRMDRLLAA